MTLSVKDEDIDNGISKRALLLTLITWLPLLIIAVFLSFTSDPSILKEFLSDFVNQLRLLFVVPFLIKIEKTINESFIEYIKAADDIVVNKQQSKFDKMVSNIDALTNLYLPEIIMLIFIYGLAIYGIKNHEIADYVSYFVNAETGNVNALGYYFLFVSYPIFQLLLFRWIWRWVVWAYSVVYISKLNLQLKAVNVDKIAGLTFINFVPFKFTIIFIAISIIIASNFGHNILYEGATIKQYSLDILFFVSLVPMLIYSPLLVFIPHLVKAKNEGVYRLGKTVSKHNREYYKKWTGKELPPDEKLLGNPDHSSLSDLNGGYAPVIEMTVLPINTKMFLMSCIVLFIPFVPLVFTYYSIVDLVKIVLDAIA